jgi:hypothetical protein
MSDEFVFEDGRKAQKVEMDHGKTKVTEIYVEPKPEKKLAQRITEKYCVCEREIEIIDENTGEVVEKIIEKVSDGQPVESLRLDSTSEEKSPMQMIVEEKLNNSKISKSTMIIAAVILLQMLALGYIVFFMK